MSTLTALWEKIVGTARITTEVRDLRAKWNQAEEDIDRRRREIEVGQHRLTDSEAAFEAMRGQRTSGFPWLADAVADYAQLSVMQRADALETKAHPAKLAAEELQEVAAKLRAADRLSRIRGYQLDYYESLFPWLGDFKDLSDEDADALASVGNAKGDEPEDAARRWLSDPEYASLSTVDKYQRALDR